MSQYNSHNKHPKYITQIHMIQLHHYLEKKNICTKLSFQQPQSTNLVSTKKKHKNITQHPSAASFFSHLQQHKIN